VVAQAAATRSGCRAPAGRRQTPTGSASGVPGLTLTPRDPGVEAGNGSGKAAQARRDNRGRAPRDGRAKVLQPPPEPPKICRQTAITIAPDIGARYRQDLPYGTPAWHARYATLRNTIEGLNGYLKDPAHQALAQPGRRRARGIAAQSICTALLPATANIRKIRAWRALTASSKASIARRARRRRASLPSYLPDG
jgi:hypothetical protein